MVELYDHESKPVHHGRARINGIRMHYINTVSSNDNNGKSLPPLLLIHGTPKTSFYWYKLIPYLSQHFSLVAPDCRGFGFTDKPPASDGYDALTNAHDLAELMTQLGHQEFYVHGEDRGAEYAYVLTASYPERVLGLSFCEMMLSGLGLEEMTYFTPDNLTAQYERRGVWNWHIPFFFIPHLPEMLIGGKEREFWEFFMRQECFNPSAIEDVALDEWVGCVKAPGGLRGVLETYRSALKNAEINRRLAKETKVKCKVMTVGAPEFFGPMVKEQMVKVCEKVGRDEVFEECGHSLALEKPERLANSLKEFFLAS